MEGSPTKNKLQFWRNLVEVNRVGQLGQDSHLNQLGQLHGLFMSK